MQYLSVTYVKYQCYISYISNMLLSVNSLYPIYISNISIDSIFKAIFGSLYLSIVYIQISVLKIKLAQI